MGAGATTLTSKHPLGLFSQAQQSKGWDPEIASVSRVERVATKISEMVSWLLGDSCHRKHLAKAVVGKLRLMSRICRSID